MKKAMHEVSIMSSIIESVLEELRKYQVEKVEEINLVIGELTFLGVEQLQFAFEVLSKGTILEGAQLTIDSEKVKVRCTACNYEGPINYSDGSDSHYALPILACPSCGERVDVILGKSCTVKSVRMVEA